MKTYRKDLACIGEALRIFGDPDGFYVKPEPLFSRGDLSTAIFDTLRGIPEGLDLSVITEAVAKSNGLDLNDATLGPLIRNRVAVALTRLCGKGELISRKGIGGDKGLEDRALGRACVNHGRIECVGRTTDHGANGPYKLWKLKRVG